MGTVAAGSIEPAVRYGGAAYVPLGGETRLGVTVG
jgi:hypothetical protein